MQCELTAGPDAFGPAHGPWRGPVRPGDAVAGFSVLTMDATTIHLQDAGGNEHTLTLRESRTVELP